MTSATNVGFDTTGASALLALDTSTERLSIALGVGERAWTHEAPAVPGVCGAAAGDPRAARAMRASSAHELDAIAFGRGPGAFTGVRTACSVAQGLAFGAGKPVLAIDSLLAVAEDARAQCRLRPMCGSRWTRAWTRSTRALCACDDARWHVLSAPALYTLDALNARWREQRAARGGRQRAGRVRRAARSAAARSAAPHAWPSAKALLSLARAAWAHGLAVDAAHALPLYLRDKVALTTAEREPRCRPSKRRLARECESAGDRR